MRLVTKLGGKFHLKLNMGERPIANKYCEGKMQRTLKRELKVRELASREATKIGRAHAELQSHSELVCRLLLEKKKKQTTRKQQKKKKKTKSTII